MACRIIIGDGEEKGPLHPIKSDLYGFIFLA